MYNGQHEVIVGWKCSQTDKGRVETDKDWPQDLIGNGQTSHLTTFGAFYDKYSLWDFLI